MHKLEFQLTQHTPIIHFQSEYEGATLRASEVKPKLDRYLLRELKKEDLNPNWFISQEKGALDYKLRFTLPEGESVQTYLPLSRLNQEKANKLKNDLRNKKELGEVKILPITPYFANEEWLNKREGQPRLAIQVGRVRGEIYTKHPKLREAIETHLEAFFLLHNFGARQTKGFGSFTLAYLDGMPLSSLRKNVADKMLKLEVVDCLVSKANVPYQMEQIAKFHNKIKTGQREQYSEIRIYSHEQSLEWEKPIERKLVGLGTEPDTKSYDKRYIRALLGLHGHFEFPQQNKRVTVSHPEIKRFASPITYKPIKDVVYLILSEVPKELFGAKFAFAYKPQGGEELSEPVYTPTKDELGGVKDFLGDFLDFVEDRDLRLVKDL
ncbi:MAG: hypothetical protein Q4A64_03775 [Porphyromonadaceae bacterium]|nr:hypothetical protein [Porphyromonadaceae bacterium]